MKHTATRLYLSQQQYIANFLTMVAIHNCKPLHTYMAPTTKLHAETHEPEIVCDNTGALFLEPQGKLVLTNQDFPVQVQLTNYKCIGMFTMFTFDYALGDASSFSKFLLVWSQIARRKSLSFSPDHRRYLLRARNLPIYSPSFDESFISCSLHDIHNISTPRTPKIVSIDGTKRTKIEAFSAYIWKIMVKAIDKGHKMCKMGWLVDGRTKICNYNKKK
uniref:Uncharacterized protein n=1 Tax=Solanum lycopersicum TaxID=4081 RepID=K4BHP3_SOLLC